MNATIHFEAHYAAHGGPGFNGPTIDRDLVMDETTAALAILCDTSGDDRWKIVDVATGNVYAVADNPRDLADWLAEYATEVGDEVDGF